MTMVNAVPNSAPAPSGDATWKGPKNLMQEVANNKLAWVEKKIQMDGY